MSPRRSTTRSRRSESSARRSCRSICRTRCWSSAAALIVIAVEAATYHAPWLRTRADDYGAQVRNRLQNGLAYSAHRVSRGAALARPGACRASRGDRRMRRDPRAGVARRRADDRRDRRRRRPATPRPSSRASRASCGRSTISAFRRWCCRPALGRRHADRPAADRAAVPRRDADCARRGVPGCDRLSHARARTVVIHFHTTGRLIGKEPGSPSRVLAGRRETWSSSPSPMHSTRARGSRPFRPRSARPATWR